MPGVGERLIACRRCGAAGQVLDVGDTGGSHVGGEGSSWAGMGWGVDRVQAC